MIRNAHRIRYRTALVETRDCLTADNLQVVRPLSKVLLPSFLIVRKLTGDAKKFLPVRIDVIIRHVIAECWSNLLRGLLRLDVVSLAQHLRGLRHGRKALDLHREIENRTALVRIVIVPHVFRVALERA